MCVCVYHSVRACTVCGHCAQVVSVHMVCLYLEASVRQLCVLCSQEEWLVVHKTPGTV